MPDQDPALAAFLAPLSPPPAYDFDLAVQIQASVAAITGLDGTLVRPRWQPEPPAQPSVTVNWCAVGATDIRSDENANTIHDSRGDGSDIVYRSEEIGVLASFYGPQASGYASLLRDGFMVQRNRAALLSLGLTYGGAGTFRNASSLVATENLIRIDFDFLLRRRVARTYAVPNIRSVSGEIRSQQGSLDGPAIGINPFEVG